MKHVRLGVVGYGNMGMPVTEWLVKEGQCPEIDVAAICDCDEARIAAAKKDYPDQGINFFADFDAMIASGKVDAVYIAVPHYDHPVLAMKAFEKGIHVMLAHLLLPGSLQHFFL